MRPKAKPKEQQQKRPTYEYIAMDVGWQCTITENGKVIGKGWGKSPSIARAAAEMDGSHD